MNKLETMDYININKNSWNAKVDYHLKSDFYFVDEFIAGRTSLNEPELELLGDIQGKKILHLQCHFGQDSISLARMGAEVTAVDLSDKAIVEARILAEKCGVDVNFIESNVYDLPNVLEEKFDIVFTSYGVIGWLPDLEKWAKVIQHFLKPNGEFIMIEFHPVIWMFDDDFTKVAYDYQSTEPIVETYEGTYADKDAAITQEYVMWNHALSEVFQSLINQNLEIKHFLEYDWSPYACFKHTVEVEKGKYRISKFDKKVPLVFSIKAMNKEFSN